MIDVSPAPSSAWTKFYSNVYSQFGEDGLLAELFKRIGATTKQCFECGAADGKWFSNSRHLIDQGWSAALVEAEPSNWPELDKLDNPPRINVVHGKAEASGENAMDSILGQCGFSPDGMDLGVIDVDGQEYYLWNGMMRFRPRVMVVEFDPHGDPNFVPDLNGKGQAGLAAICSVAVSKGYFNVATTHTNLIFVRNDLKEKFQASVAEMEDANSRIKPEDNPFVQMNSGPSAPPILPAHPVLATGKEQEIKIAAVLSRPRFGLNCFWDCASEALTPFHIPLQSFTGVFWSMCMEKAMEENIAAGVDWLLTLDYDSVFSSIHLQQLIDCLAQNPHIDAVAALQQRRGRPLALMVRPDGQAPMTGGPVQATTAHFGLTLFRTESIKKLAKPWFWSKPDAAGSWGEGRLDDDIYFWGKWRDAGNTLYVHTGCRVGHVEEMVAHYNDKYEPTHMYLTKWRQDNGQRVKPYD